MSEDQYTAIQKEVSLPCVRVRADRAGGSGTVIYSSDGDEHVTYVLTNHHVVEDLIKVEEHWDSTLQRQAKRDIRGLPSVEFFEYVWESRDIGTTAVQAEIAAYDEDEDLALLRLRSSRAVPAVAKLYPKGAESKLRRGMPLYAVGAGLGEPPVLTGGFLSAFGREIDHKEFWLSTAPTIFGNSGGALFLAKTHEFIGVPARIAVMGMFGSADAITHLSFGIPVTRVYDFLEAQCFRHIFDDDYTEEGEAAERKRRLEADRRRLTLEEQANGLADFLDKA